MYITRVYVEGFKRFTQFELKLNPTFNVIVGDNETGKSSLLEAIGLVLTGQYEGISFSTPSTRTCSMRRPSQIILPSIRTVNLLVRRES